ncbi:hypothetical protein ACTJJ7_22345 [Phyllobacterium sp. 22229]|uniref:hypothetical protein n=1 Tax=Phyllobacterium sp. 22229 TaxID=3453895 RepID=UPI003F82BEBE
MPFVEIRYSRDSLNEAERQRIADRIAVIAMNAEGLPDNPMSRSISIVTYQALDDVYVGGAKVAVPRFFVVFHAFAEVLTKAGTAMAVMEMTQVFAEESDYCRGAGTRTVWCIFNGLTPHSFAGGGQLVSYEQVLKMTSQ